MLVRVQTKASCKTRKDIFKTSGGFFFLHRFQKQGSGNKPKWTKTSNKSHAGKMRGVWYAEHRCVCGSAARSVVHYLLLGISVNSDAIGSVCVRFSVTVGGNYI